VGPDVLVRAQFSRTAELRSAGQVGTSFDFAQDRLCPYAGISAIQSWVQAGISPAHRAAGTAALQNRGGFGAEFVEDVFQFGGDVRGLAMFDVAALHHVDQLAVAQKRN
jgi:hypothetical protein